MRKIKKITACILAILLVLSSVPAAFPAEVSTETSTIAAVDRAGRYNMPDSMRYDSVVTTTTLYGDKYSPVEGAGLSIVFTRLNGGQLVHGKQYIIVTNNRTDSSGDTSVNAPTGTGYALTYSGSGIAVSSSPVTTEYTETLPVWDSSMVWTYTSEGYFQNVEDSTKYLGYPGSGSDVNSYEPFAWTIGISASNDIPAYTIYKPNSDTTNYVRYQKRDSSVLVRISNTESNFFIYGTESTVTAGMNSENIKPAGPETGTGVYSCVDHLPVEGKNYIIVTTNGSSGRAVGLNGSSVVRTEYVTKDYSPVISNNTLASIGNGESSVSDSFVFTYSNGRFVNKADPTKYLSYDGNSLSVTSTNSWTITKSGLKNSTLQAFTFSNGSNYLNVSSSPVIGSSYDLLLYEEETTSGSGQTPAEPQYIEVTTYERVSEIENGKNYMIVTPAAAGKAIKLNGNSLTVTSNGVISDWSDTIASENVDDSIVWTYNDGVFQNKGSTSNYIGYTFNNQGNALLSLTSTKWKVTTKAKAVNGSITGFTFSTKKNPTRYLNYGSELGVTGSATSFMLYKEVVTQVESPPEPVEPEKGENLITESGVYVLYSAAAGGVFTGSAEAAEAAPDSKNDIYGDYDPAQLTFTVIDDSTVYVRNADGDYLNLSSDGTVSFTPTAQALTQENYDGRLRLSADGISLSFSDGGFTAAETSFEDGMFFIPYTYEGEIEPETEETAVQNYVRIASNGTRASQSLRMLPNVTAETVFELAADTNIKNAELVWEIYKQYNDNGEEITDGGNAVASITPSADGTTAAVAMNGTDGSFIIKLSTVYQESSESVFEASDYIKFIVSTGELKPLTDTSDRTNFPEYPNDGSVFLDKYVTDTSHFYTDGILRLNLDVTGIPTKGGVDVVFVLDVSSSMTKYDVSGDPSGTKRIDSAKNATLNFIDQLFADNPDGSPSDNRVAIVKFAPNGPGDTTNGYVTEMDDWPQFSGDQPIVFPLSDASQKDAVKAAVKNTPTAIGTNYDNGLLKAQQILGEEGSSSRKQFVVFLSDGKPTQYNNRSWESSTSSQTMPTGSDTNLRFYREVGAYKFASDYVPTEADKGETYYEDYGKGPKVHTTAEQMKSNGVTIYSIAFDITTATTDNYYLTAAQAFDVIETLASTVINEQTGEEELKAFNISATSQLNETLSDIVNEIKYAGTRAYVDDIVGSDFSLEFTPRTLRDGETQFIPDISIGLSDTDADGHKIPSSYKELEKVTFTVNTNGELTGAYSSADPTGANRYNSADNEINAVYFTYSFTTKTFRWNIGNITRSKITLAYDVYLDGSMEGTRDSGTYPTNESAYLYYYNHFDNLCRQTFPIPLAPWGEARVSYQFYLVNENGDPVNMSGQKVTFKQRTVVVPEKVAKKVNLNETNIRIDPVQLLAYEKIPDGYVLYTADGIEPQYMMYSDSYAQTWNGSATLGKGVVEYRGGSNGLENRGQFNDVAVAFPLLYTLSLFPDTVVVDYGLPVNINVLANDLAADNKIYGLSGDNAELADGAEYFTEVPFAEESYTGIYGTAEAVTPATSNTEQVRYTLTTDMSGIETLYYCAGSGTLGAYKTEKITVIPASTVYYEDNFANSSWINYQGGWTTVGREKSTSVLSQDTDRPGFGTFDDADNNYNYDSSYDTANEFSLGSAHFSSPVANDTDYCEFTFKGTGFDIISRTDATSGYILVRVSKYENGRWKVVNKQTVCNYYESGEMYQVPVINCYNLPYATYKVFIGVIKNDDLFEQCNFWLDGVRIYNPINPDEKQTAVEAYELDREAYETTIELRDLLISADELGGSAVYIDGGVTAEMGNHEFQLERILQDASEKATEISYVNRGPNNELYLGKNQSVSFVLVGNFIRGVTSAQLSAKAPDGTPANLYVTATTSTAGTDGGQTYSSVVAANRAITSSTDMYYDITKAVSAKAGTVGTNTSSATITVTNTGEGVLALTNLKICTGAGGGTSYYNSETDEDFYIEPARPGLLSARAPMKAMAVAGAFAAEANRTALDGATVTYNLAPETKIQDPVIENNSITLGDEITLTFGTGESVSDVVIRKADGTEITPTKVSARAKTDSDTVYGENTAFIWTVSFIPDGTGCQVYTVAAANGDAGSATVEINVEAAPEPTTEPTETPEETDKTDETKEKTPTFIRILKKLWNLIKMIIDFIKGIVSH